MLTLPYLPGSSLITLIAAKSLVDSLLACKTRIPNSLTSSNKVNI